MRHVIRSLLVAPQNFLDWRAQQTAFSGIAAIGYASVSLKAEGGQEPETVIAQAVTSVFFPVPGIAPLVGRTFALENERPPHARVAVISYGVIAYVVTLRTPEIGYGRARSDRHARGAAAGAARRQGRPGNRPPSRVAGPGPVSDVTPDVTD